MKNIYTSLNMTLLRIAGLYSYDIKNNLWQKLYSVYTAGNFAVSVLIFVWATFGVVKSNLKVVEDPIAVLQLSE